MTTDSNYQEISVALQRLSDWTERSGWEGYDTFDGLSTPFRPVLTFGFPLLRQLLQQAVRRFPINLRPLLLIKPSMSSKAMGFYAQGYLRLYESFGKEEFLKKGRFCLEWLMENRSSGYVGYCWGNHFEYESRGGCIPKGVPTIVWTGLIGHAFLDAFDRLEEERYLDVAKSVCECICNEMRFIERTEGVCLNYTPTPPHNLIHNSNMIGASILARVHAITGNETYRELAEQAVAFTVHHQTAAGGWHYGVGAKWEWIDNFHTGYVLEALDHYNRWTGSPRFTESLQRGYGYFIDTFFLPDGTPKYYDTKIAPLDIQCASQAIQTLVNLRHLNSRSMETAMRVTRWTIRNMQDTDGHFFYRKYPFITNKTATLHWGQATMFSALAGVVERLCACRSNEDGSLSAVNNI